VNRSRDGAIAPYSRRFRFVETGAVWIFGALFAALAARGYAVPPASSMQIAMMLLLGAIAADLASGLVHWAADTWGNQGWPVVGPTLIRSFREHHLDQRAITHHGFIETNGATALVLLPVLLGIHLILPRDADAWSGLHRLGCLFALSVTMFMFMTNQIHKWSHLDRAPGAVRLLQSLRVILTTEHHQLHHVGSHAARYCITTGWLNPVLDRLRFFRRSETLIQAVTRLQPREDDLQVLERSAGCSPQTSA
jgi:plasmanylethanolamine desaturase